LEPQLIWNTIKLVDELNALEKEKDEIVVRKFTLDKAMELGISHFEVMLKLLEGMGWWALGWRVAENCVSLEVGDTAHFYPDWTSPPKAVIVQVIDIKGGQLIRLGHPNE